MEKVYDEALEEMRLKDWELIAKNMERERNTFMVTNKHLNDTIKRMEKMVDILINVVNNLSEREG